MSTRITIFCRTNLDDYKDQRWPDSLPAVPSVGQRMTSERGKTLKIVSLTWQYDGTLRVELHH